MGRSRWAVRVVGWFLMGAFVGAGASSAAAQQPTLTPDDYDRWEQLGGFELDPTGRWLVASVARVDGDAELRVHAADGSGEPLVLEHGRAPTFSRDGRWLAYLKGVSAEEREQADGPVPDRLGLVDLGADAIPCSSR